jgi:nitrilase
VKVAAAQAHPAWLDKAANTKKILSLLRQAAGQDVELIAFPEAFLSGYPFWVSRTDGARFEDTRQKAAYAYYLDAAIELPGPEVTLIAEASADLGIFVYLGVTERGRAAGRGTVWCTLVAIAPGRGIVGTHRKLLPTYDERLVWGQGDGHGLRTHEAGTLRVSGLNCWENWMPQARTVLYAEGTDLHVGVWPGSRAMTETVTRFVALEGRVWSLAASGLLSIDDVPRDFPLYDELSATASGLIFDGGSGIVSPEGIWVSGPAVGREGLVTAHINRDMIDRERLSFDPTGHYSRPDVLSTTVDRRRRAPTVTIDDP